MLRVELDLSLCRRNVNKFKIYIDLIRILREKLPGRNLIYMFVPLVAAVLYYRRYLQV